MCAPCAWNGSTVPCGDAGVEEIVGLPFPLGMAGVVWVCFWVPGPPPHGGFHCGAVPMPMRSSRRPLDAWWNVWRVAV